MGLRATNRGRPKLTQEQADKIRKLRGTPTRALAERFGVSQTCIRDILNGMTYRQGKEE
jgi:hypothetical protein